MLIQSQLVHKLPSLPYGVLLNLLANFFLKIRAYFSLTVQYILKYFA